MPRWKSSPDLLGVTAAEELVLAAWSRSPLSCGSRARACVESWLLRSRLAHQRQEVTGLGEHSTSVGDPAVRAPPPPGRGEPTSQASPFRAVVPFTLGA